MSIEELSPSAPEVLVLFELLNEHNRARVGSSLCRWATGEELEAENCVLLGIRMAGRLGAIGAVVHEAGYSEVKRMFVLPEFRGTGLAVRLLDELQRRALLAGNATLRLDFRELPCRSGLLPEARFSALRAFWKIQGTLGELLHGAPGLICCRLGWRPSP